LGAADAFPDPSVIKAKDGYWYAYGTTTRMLKDNPVPGHAGNHFLPIIRSKDLIHWEYVGDVFGPGNYPEWVPFDGGTYYWAPDIRYVDGAYYLYYSSVYYGVTGHSRYQIGLATAPSPAGPWTDSGGPVVGPSSGTVTIDPALFTDEDGTHYLYYGSFDRNGILVTKLSPDGKRAVGEPVQVVSGYTGEAPYVVKRGPYYYLFYSDFGCCSNTFSSYTVFVGRSESPLGPFVDREGVPLSESRVGGTIVNATNGNRWIGTGHNAIVKDVSGQEWMFFNGIDKDDAQNSGYRPMMMDRLDWIDGWPAVRAGAFASDGSEPGPVTAWTAGSDFNGNESLDGGLWLREGAARGGWRLQRTDERQAHVLQETPAAKNAYLVSSQSLSGDLRAEADLRLIPHPSGAGKVGLAAGYRGTGDHIISWLDAESHALVTEVTVGGSIVKREQTPLRPSFRFDHWHHLAIEIRGASVSVELTPARLGDPAAVQHFELPAGAGGADGSIGVASRSAKAEADNIGAAPLYSPVLEAVPEPEIGTLDPAFSDEFDDGVLDEAWSWVRTPAGEETGGVYRWPTQTGELRDRAASVLLRDAPEGDYTIETKMNFPLGTDTNRNFQQAGLVAYDSDSRSVRLISIAYHTARQIKAAKEENGGSGTMRIGPAADVLWLRLAHRVDPVTGEHEFRAASSRDGEYWVWGGVWTLPPDANPRIGLLSMGGQGGTAEFEYFRVYRQSAAPKLLKGEAT
jgi:beta-xylosidase